MYHVTVVIDFVDYICRIFEIQTMKPFIVPSKQCCPTCGPPAHFVWPAAVLYCFEGQFPEMSCKKVLTMFGSTYVCKAGFSAMNNIKSKKRNSLTDEHLENLLRAAVTQYQPQIKRVAATFQSQISH